MSELRVSPAFALPEHISWLDIRPWKDIVNGSMFGEYGQEQNAGTRVSESSCERKIERK